MIEVPRKSDCSADPDKAADNTRRRLEALRALEILDTPTEQDFDDIAALIAHICQTPVALISFVDANRQYFKAAVGTDLRETGLDTSICRHAILQDDIFCVPDTLLDERTAENPLVKFAPHFRFYAGAPLKLEDGLTVGTLCVLDHKPRELSEGQRDALTRLARQVMSQLRVRRINSMQQTNILQLKTLEEQWHAAKESAEEAMRSKDRFLAFLSHELRTPLTPVLLTTSAMASDERLPEDVRSDARMINRNIAFQTRLVDDLLDVTRLASGKLELHPEPVDICELVRNVAQICKIEAQQKKIRFSLDQAGEPSTVRGDAARLQQVMLNVLKNAVKFTPSNGTIQIVTTVKTEANDSPGAIGRSVSILIRDSGIGIDAKELSNIFGAYQQGANTITRQYGGLGLGLAIARGIVDAHGGSLAVESAGLGKGATFTITLPMIAPPEPKKAKSPTRPLGTVESTATKASILLVDDHEDTLRAMSRLLKRMHHKVVTATSVQTALDAASKEKFDVVISDVGLPDGTGMDLMRELLGRHPIRGIAVTGYGAESDIIDTREAGFSTHLTKPIDVSALEAAIGKLTN